MSPPKSSDARLQLSSGKVIKYILTFIFNVVKIDFLYFMHLSLFYSIIILKFKTYKNR